MTDARAPIAPLEQLVQKWRDYASVSSVRVKSLAVRQCADELEALIRSAREPRPAVTETKAEETDLTHMDSPNDATARATGGQNELLQAILKELRGIPTEWQAEWSYDNPNTRAHACLRDALADLYLLRFDLWDIAGTIVAICEDGNANARELACSETSPLVDRAREVIRRYGLSNDTTVLPSVGEAPSGDAVPVSPERTDEGQD